MSITPADVADWENTTGFCGARREDGHLAKHRWGGRLAVWWQRKLRLKNWGRCFRMS